MLTYKESSTLMTNLIFQGRVKVACLTYARYIMDEGANTPAHSTRIRWAQQTLQMPDAAAGAVSPTVVMDSAVPAAAIDTDGDSTIDDPGLQSATENSVNKML
jgi:hypothetical protein